MSKLKALHVSLTYDGCLDGIPTVAAQVQEAKNKAERLFGKRATMPLWAGTRDELLPKWEHIAWFAIDGQTVADKDADGSEVVAIWWDDVIATHADIEELFIGMNWGLIAEDFYY